MDFDLSWNKSLQTLEVLADSVDIALLSSPLDTAARLLKYALSTAQPPLFSQLSIIYQEDNFRARKLMEARIYPPTLLQDVKEEKLLHQKQFELLREVRKVRDFQLVLYADVLECNAGWVVPMLMEAVTAENARGGFNDLFPEPLVTFVPRSFSRPVVHM